MSAFVSAESMTVLIVDDNESHLELLRSAVTTALSELDGSWEVQSHLDASEALAELPAAGQGVILCDYRLHNTTGLDWLPDFVRADIGPIIIVTSSGGESIAAEAFRQGAMDYIDKETAISDPALLRTAITESLRRYSLERTNRGLARKLKLANLELKTKNETLADLTETAHRFVEDVAHEFRTPLTVIREFAAIMQDGIGGEVTPKQESYLSFIKGATRDLASLIDDFLDSGKLRAQTLRVDRRPLHVDEILDSCWEMLEARSTTKNIELRRRVEDGLPLVFADADKARRTLVNLVVNAVKFSNPGDEVTIRASQESTSRVTFSVQDRGPGMSEEETRSLFERFNQGSDSHRINTTGFGLGLNIVKELVAINLGCVSVVSEKDKGSTFSFAVPEYDTESIVDAYARTASVRSPGKSFSVLSVARESESAPTEGLHGFLASVCHAMDLQLPAVHGRSVVLAGETAEPEHWRDRLLRLDERDRNQAKKNSLARIGVRVHGTWPVRDLREELLARVAHDLREVQHA